jgi:hypothetical protein
MSLALTHGSIGKHDWALGQECEDGIPVFVDDRQLSYRKTHEKALAYAQNIIERLIADGDYRLSDRPAGFLPPELQSKETSVQIEEQNSIAQVFLGLLKDAWSVVVEGKMLSGWTVAQTNGDKENEVALFTWEEDGSKCSMKLTESGVSGGEWFGDTFFCNDSEGKDVRICMYKHLPLSPNRN